MTKSKKNSSEYEILAGHTKVGSKFTQFPNKLTETRYAEALLPELLWIGLLNEELGEEVTLRILVAMAKSIGPREEGNEKWFVFAQYLAKLPETEIASMKQHLAAENLLTKIQTALGPFFDCYPMFPVDWLELQPMHNPDYLPRFKQLLNSLIDKRSRASTLMLAGAVYGLLVSGMLIVPDSSFVHDMNCLLEYPHTDRSKLVASSIRAMTTTLICTDSTERTELGWAWQFWQRGLELEAPDFPALLRGAAST